MNFNCSRLMVPQKEGIISKRFTGQKITPYVDLREQSLYYTVKKNSDFSPAKGNFIKYCYIKLNLSVFIS